MSNRAPRPANSNGSKSGREETVFSSPAEFWKHFDSQARQTVHVSGKEALKRIRRGKYGSNLAWTELMLLSSLLQDQ
jgi:uncharacterized protein (DUF2461 family)